MRFVALIISLAFAAAVHAQTYPTRAVKVNRSKMAGKGGVTSSEISPPSQVFSSHARLCSAELSACLCEFCPPVWKCAFCKDRSVARDGLSVPG